MVGNNRDTFGDGDVLIGTDRIIGTGQSDSMIPDGSFTREAVGDGDQLMLISGATVADSSRLFGGDGDDSLFGANGADFLFGGAGCNITFGSDGDDTYLSTGGNKTFHGEGGNDDVSFDLIGAAVIVDLNFGNVFTTDTASVLSGTPRLLLSQTGVEAVTGTALADRITGTAGDNRLKGGAGNDTIIGDDGVDSLDGGAGTDTLDCSAGTKGVRINLSIATGNAADGFGNLETVTTFALPPMWSTDHL